MLLTKRSRNRTESEVRDIAPVVLRNVQRRMEMEGLWQYAERVALVTADRVFFVTSERLAYALESLTYHERFAAGHPSGGPHRMVYSLFRDEPGQWGRQRTWRSFSKPSLQVTLTWKGMRVFGDADIDLGNPLADVVGFFTHLAELLTPGKTDHRKLEKRIVREYEKWKEERNA